MTAMRGLVVCLAAWGAHAITKEQGVDALKKIEHLGCEGCKLLCPSETTLSPSPGPTTRPTTSPTFPVTPVPTTAPLSKPTHHPTHFPTLKPTHHPTHFPT